MQIWSKKEHPTCPYCETELKPFVHVGYYDEVEGWECLCNIEQIPDCNKYKGSYS